MERNLALLDYRRRVAAMYGRVRDAKGDSQRVWEQFCSDRDELFRDHPQSPLSLEQKQRFVGLKYYPYNRDFRFVVPVARTAEQTVEVELQEDGIVKMRRFGQVSFPIGKDKYVLSLYWIHGYGGGVFLPFRDATGAGSTYGGGRYLLDTIKHADLGSTEDSVVIDFNYAYNPSCAYNPRWSCPLSPPENSLPVAVLAGELRFTGTT